VGFEPTVPCSTPVFENGVRNLQLGKADEWHLSAQVAHHPFHIHVNPFEIIEHPWMVDDEMPRDEKGRRRTIWKDTIIVPDRQGTVKIRSRYERYIGMFVLHCHILDHEDQGMMQLVKIVGPGAHSHGSIEKTDAAESTDSDLGKNNRISDAIPAPKGKPSVVFFVKGSACHYCMSQLTKMAGALSGQDVGVSVVTASSVKDLQEFPRVPFRLIADPNGKLFKKFGAMQDGEAQHATLVMNDRGKELFRDVGDEPVMDAAAILRSIRPRSTPTRLSPVN